MAKYKTQTGNFEGKPIGLHKMLNPIEILEGPKYSAGKTHFSKYERKSPWIIPFFNRIKTERGTVKKVELDGQFFWTNVRVYLYQGQIIEFPGLSHSKAKELKSILESEDPEFFPNM